MQYLNYILMLCVLLAGRVAWAQNASLEVVDTPVDDGTSLDVRALVNLPEMDPDSLAGVKGFVVQQSEEPNGIGKQVFRMPLERPENSDSELAVLEMNMPVSGLHRGRPYYFTLYAEDDQGTLRQLATTDNAIVPVRNDFDGNKTTLLLVLVGVCGSVVGFILLARRGMQLHIRPIAGLQAIDEAVGRATEMGRSCIFIPGIQDMNDMQTIAGINILSRVSRVAAEYDCDVEVPTSRSLVMTAAAETVQSAFLLAGRPDGFNPDMIYYVTDEQFGFVAYLTGKMVREEPAACFYLGSFYAESLILAETGNAVGAIQVAGTAQPSQLPFFVAACDYTLIGEELFAASAYLSGSPEELGSLKGQDIGKILGALAMLVGSIFMTLSVLMPELSLQIRQFFMIW